MNIETMESLPETLLDRINWDDDESWYALENIRAFFDRRLKLWTVYEVDANDYQISSCEYFNNKGDYIDTVRIWRTK
jgi:hypothetical protein